MTEVDVIPDQGDGGTTERPDCGNGVVVYDTWEQMQRSWLDRALALQEEMQRFGFASIFVACSHDALMAGRTERLLCRRGNYYTVLGLLTDAANELMTEG